MTNKKFLKSYFNKMTETASLAVFRILFGLLILFSILRFWYKGWIDLLYVKPNFFFSYYGFEFIKPIGDFTYWLFLICGIAAFFVMIGFKYRFSIITLFLIFTYIELMDKSNYLNHYYFVSLMSFILCFLPSNANYSFDAYLDASIRRKKIPQFCVDVIKLMLIIVYFYAGLAKLNSDWLFRASPLSGWLRLRYDYFLIGPLMRHGWFHYLMSWAGALYDLVIPFMLLYRPTRKLAFLLVVIFHVMTGVLFPIGMFPYIMIVSTIIFFESKVQYRIISFLTKILKLKTSYFKTDKVLSRLKSQKIIVPIFVVFFVVQLLLPFRYLLYPGELFWTEEGYCFSWRVMLVEKAGYASFKVVDNDTKKEYYIDNKNFLKPHQEKYMSFQPDFILQYAHYLGDIYKQKGIKNPSVYVDNYVTLNGRLSTRFVKENIDLYAIKDSFKHKIWIEEFKHSIPIKGI